MDVYAVEQYSGLEREGSLMCTTAHAQVDPEGTGLRASHRCKRVWKTWLCALDTDIFFRKQGELKGVRPKTCDATRLRHGL